MQPLTLCPTCESPLCFRKLPNPQLRTSFFSAAVSTTTCGRPHQMSDLPAWPPTSKTGQRQLAHKQWRFLQSVGCPHEGVLSLQWSSESPQWLRYTWYLESGRPGFRSQLCHERHWVILVKSLLYLLNLRFCFSKMVLKQMLYRVAVRIKQAFHKWQFKNIHSIHVVYTILLAPLKGWSRWIEVKKLIKAVFGKTEKPYMRKDNSIPSS